MDVEWIRKALMRAGKSQRGLAAALSVDPAAINRLVKGERQLKAHEIPLVQAYFDERPGERAPGEPPPPFRPQPVTADRLPVLGMAECGPDGWSLWNGEIVDYVARPPNLAGNDKAYAVFVVGDSMEPRYHPGELVYVHPGRPVMAGAYVLVEIKPKSDGEAPRAVLKRLAKRTGAKIVLEQFNPRKTFDMKADEVTMHRVVGSGEP